MNWLKSEIWNWHWCETWSSYRRLECKRWSTLTQTWDIKLSVFKNFLPQMWEVPWLECRKWGIKHWLMWKMKFSASAWTLDETRVALTQVLTWRQESCSGVSCRAERHSALWESRDSETEQPIPRGFEHYVLDFLRPSSALPPAGQSSYFFLWPFGAGEWSESEGRKETCFHLYFI